MELFRRFFSSSKVLIGLIAMSSMAPPAESGPVGIIGAMDNEIELLKGRMDIQSVETCAGMTFFCGLLCSHPVVLVRCGVGKINAAICAQVLILRFHVESIINTGVAGSLNADIDIGDIVVSTDSVEHDMDVTSLGYEIGIIPGNAQSIFRADESLRKNAILSAAVAAPDIHVFEGRVASGDQFIADSAKKQSIIRNFGAFCCEMEGAAIGQVCVQNDIPYVIIRAISDKADDSGHVSYRDFVEAAARHSASIVLEMIQNL